MGACACLLVLVLVSRNRISLVPDRRFPPLWAAHNGASSDLRAAIGETQAQAPFPPHFPLFRCSVCRVCAVCERFGGAGSDLPAEIGGQWSALHPVQAPGPNPSNFGGLLPLAPENSIDNGDKSAPDGHAGMCLVTTTVPLEEISLRPAESFHTRWGREENCLWLCEWPGDPHMPRHG